MPFDYPTTSPASGLAGGLAAGIFDAISKRKDEAKRQEADAKKQSLQFLASLIDQVEPDSRPQLLKQMGDVMGLKGKHRSFWDRLTGAGLDSGRQAVEERMNSILGSLYGPEEAGRLRGGDIKIQEQQPARPVRGGGTMDTLDFGLRVPGLTVGQRPNQLPEGAIVMADPDQAKLERLRTQYGMQFAQRQALQDDAQAAIRSRQLELQQQGDALRRRNEAFKAELKANQDIDELANIIAAHQKRPVEQRDRQAAANALLTRAGIDDAMKEALLRLRDAQTTLAQSQANNLGPTGLTPYQQESLNIRKGEIESKRDDKAQAVYTEWEQARERYRAQDRNYRSQVEELKAAGQDLGLVFDEETRSFKASSPERAATLIVVPNLFGAQLKELRNVARDRDIARKEMETKWNIIRTPRFQRHLKTGKTAEDDVQWSEVAPSASGAPSSGGAGGGAINRRTLPSINQADRSRSLGQTRRLPNDQNYQLGQTVKTPDGLYRVIALESDPASGRLNGVAVLRKIN